MEHIDNLASFLRRSDIDLYFRIHPNQVSLLSFNPPQEWNSWWDWAGEPYDSPSSSSSSDSPSEPWCTTKWQLLWFYYRRDSLPTWLLDSNSFPASGEDTFQTIPIKLRNIIDEARSLKLPRGKPKTLDLRFLACLRQYSA